MPTLEHLPAPEHQAEQYDIILDECINSSALILEAFVEIDNRIANLTLTANNQLEDN